MISCFSTGKKKGVRTHFIIPEGTSSTFSGLHGHKQHPLCLWLSSLHEKPQHATAWTVALGEQEQIHTTIPGLMKNIFHMAHGEVWSSIAQHGITRGSASSFPEATPITIAQTLSFCSFFTASIQPLGNHKLNLIKELIQLKYFPLI